MIPKFSNDPEQDAEMRAQYFFECRIQGINPFASEEREYDPYEDEDYGEEEYYDEDEPEGEVTDD